MDTVYRIYTEDADRETVVGVVSRKFEGFTLHTAATGYFKGSPKNRLSSRLLRRVQGMSRKSLVLFALSTVRKRFW